MDEDSETRRIALLITGLSSFLTPFMGSAINIAIPAIGGEFEAEAATLGWVASSYLIAAAVLVVPFGRLADIYGRKRIFTSGIIIFTASSFSQLFQALWGSSYLSGSSKVSGAP